MLGLEETLNLLKKYKIPFVETKIIQNIPKNIDFPVVLKAFSVNLIHKVDKGAVITNIHTRRDLIKNYKLLRKKFPDAKVVMQKQLNGLEIIAGFNKDKDMGNFIMFGLGGIYTQIFKDISFRVCPISISEAKKMINDTKISKALYGYRGQKYKIKPLINILVNLCKLGMKENVCEIDLNPIIINEKGAWAVDFRIIS